jgi:hypothetical protein
MKTKLIVSTLILAAWVLTACSQPTVSAPTGGTATPANGCPAETADTQIFTNDSHGYCASIPSGYSVQYPFPEEVIIQPGSQIDPVDALPRVYIWVAEANGRTTESFAKEVSAGAEAFNVEQSPITLGGADAILINNLPGQDLSHQVVIVRGELSYRLTFVPLGIDAKTDQKVEALYALITQSFSFSSEG